MMSVTNRGAFVLSGVVGGLIIGGLGAAVANSSRSYPVLKGAAAALEAVLAGAIIAVTTDRTNTGTLSGPPAPLPLGWP